MSDQDNAARGREPQEEPIEEEQHSAEDHEPSAPGQELTDNGYSPQQDHEPADDEAPADTDHEPADDEAPADTDHEPAEAESAEADQEPTEAAPADTDHEPTEAAPADTDHEPTDADHEPTDGEKPAKTHEEPADGDSADERKPTDEPASPEKTGSARKSRKPVSPRAKVLVVAMSALLGFGIVIQVRHTQEDEFSALRQDDLVRLLDEVTQRNEDLADERDQLLRDRASLRSGSDSQRLAQEYQLVHGVLAGTEPVEGPGVVVSVENSEEVSAQTMVHMLEELRNAGAEAVELSGQRLVASSAFVDSEDGVRADGQLLTDPMEWRAIGNAQTMAVALDIPGGALAGFRNAGARVEVEQRNLVQITAIREAAEPEFAVPSEPED